MSSSASSHPPPDLESLRQHLVETDILQSHDAILTPLTGGVSCDVVKVHEPSSGKTFVVKRALEKLRVKDDWFADPVRNAYEHRYMTEVARFLPDAVPEVTHTDDANGLFSMSYLGDGWTNWKDALLQGQADPATAARAGHVLGTIHRQTSGNNALKEAFDTSSHFHDLRLEPYLLTTGSRHPELEHLFHEESERVYRTRECLVHGDFSPKNIMIRNRQLVVLDCEVAWFGDPRFDVAFLLNHFHLKGLYHGKGSAESFALLPDAFLTAYQKERELDPLTCTDFLSETARLLLMLMLARVDGKSPVEYFQDSPEKQQWIRDFVYRYLPDWKKEPRDPRSLTEHWFKNLPETNLS